MTGFAEKVKRLRDREDLSQAKLARLLKVEPGTVSRWERGGPADPGNVEKVEELLSASGATPHAESATMLTLIAEDQAGRRIVLGQFVPSNELLSLLDQPAVPNMKVGIVRPRHVQATNP